LKQWFKEGFQHGDLIRRERGATRTKELLERSSGLGKSLTNHQIAHGTKVDEKVNGG